MASVEIEKKRTTVSALLSQGALTNLMIWTRELFLDLQTAVSVAPQNYGVIVLSMKVSSNCLIVLVAYIVLPPFGPCTRLQYDGSVVFTCTRP